MPSIKPVVTILESNLVAPDVRVNDRAGNARIFRISAQTLDGRNASAHALSGTVSAAVNVDVHGHPNVYIDLGPQKVVPSTYSSHKWDTDYTSRWSPEDRAEFDKLFPRAVYTYDVVSPEPIIINGRPYAGGHLSAEFIPEDSDQYVSKDFPATVGGVKGHWKTSLGYDSGAYTNSARRVLTDVVVAVATVATSQEVLDAKILASAFASVASAEGKVKKLERELIQAREEEVLARHHLDELRAQSAGV